MIWSTHRIHTSQPHPHPFASSLKNRYWNVLVLTIAIFMHPELNPALSIMLEIPQLDENHHVLPIWPSHWHLLNQLILYCAWVVPGLQGTRASSHSFVCFSAQDHDAEGFSSYATYTNDVDTQAKSSVATQGLLLLRKKLAVCDYI